MRLVAFMGRYVSLGSSEGEMLPLQVNPRAVRSVRASGTEGRCTVHYLDGSADYVVGELNDVCSRLVAE